MVSALQILSKESKMETLIDTPLKHYSLPIIDGKIREFINSGSEKLVVDGLYGSSKALVLSSLFSRNDKRVLIVVSSLAEAEKFARDLRFFESPASDTKDTSRIRIFSRFQGYSTEDYIIHDEDGEIIDIMFHLLEDEPLWIVTTIQEIASHLPYPGDFYGKILNIGLNGNLSRDELPQRLSEMGYEHVDIVRRLGEYATRGGIVDVFSPSCNFPVRIEFFSDEVESIRVFDPENQRSTSEINQVSILPILMGSTDNATLLDYLGNNTIVVLDEPGALINRAEEDGIMESSDLEDMFKDKQRIEFHLVELGDNNEESCRLGFNCKPVENFHGNFKYLFQYIRQCNKERERVRIICQQEGQAKRMQDILRDNMVWAGIARNPCGDEFLSILMGDLSQGFEFTDLGLVFITENEIFGERRRSLRRPKYKRGSSISSFSDLQNGDYVVHIDYGIGIYKGLVKLTIDDLEGDYLHLRYASGDKLYLPIQRLNLISKYTGSQGEVPRIDKLGGHAWAKIKENARSSIRKVAQDLLELYAKRQIMRGHTFAKDTSWQQEFESAFRYEETLDQIEAIHDVKRDMESLKPMDRLICGDVGYGKTEVAMRAAFKAVMDGKQVAMLVPTTVLAQQHYQTFSERFMPYPVSIMELSRFKTRKEQTEILKGLKNGTVDVVIGTHRLLSNDVIFKDLGVIIIDEEQRFGVAHKEKLKKLKENIDVITLTATPIPRTLQMAFFAIRDMSTIETPPLERLSIETIISKLDEKIIRKAIVAELGRNGQVFFVHNRVESLPALTKFVERLVPEAKVVMAHGQMNERELEKVMYDFVNCKYNVLVSTAIIESGIDIPSVNTIIINRADRFGLAQLYQLRGRVGRDKSQAYAYLLVPPSDSITNTARKRLKIIREFSDLGSGFKIASKDLEIRGAGNLLGVEQHGYIAAMGFELYCQLLEKTIKELKGIDVQEEVDPFINLKIEAYIPEYYINDINQRLNIYKRIAMTSNFKEIEELEEEMKDRYGKLPEESNRLLQIMDLRILARKLKIEKIEHVEDRVLFTFSPNTSVSTGLVLDLIKSGDRKINLVKDFVLEIGILPTDWGKIYRNIREFLESLRENSNMQKEIEEKN